MNNVQKEALMEFTVNIFKSLGVPENDAEIAADVLVQADIRGTETHGVSRLPLYAKRVKAGLVNTTPEIKIEQREGVFIVDGDHGLGSVVTNAAIESCIRMAREIGIAAAVIKNTNHFGIAAYYALKAIDNDMIGFITTNTTPCMAPFGGCEALIGTNPIAIGIPSGTSLPIVLDMATSITTHGRLEVAYRRHERIPLGWALDEQGKPTDNPGKAMHGTVLPIAGPKGYGLAVIVDVLAGVLSGSAYGRAINNIVADKKPENIGHFLLAVDPNRFMPIDTFKERMDDYIAEIKSSSKAHGTKQIFLPGEIEFMKAEKHQKSGIPLDEKLVENLSKLAQELNVTWSF